MDRALRLYQRNGVLILGRTAAATVMSLAAWAFFVSFALPSIGGAFGPEGVSFGAVISIVATLFVAVPMFVLGIAWNVALVIEVTHRTLRGDPVDDDDLATTVFKRLAIMARVIGRTMLLSNSVTIFAWLSIALGTAKSANTVGVADVLVGFGVFGLFVGFIFSIVGFGKSFLAPAVLMIESLTSTRDVIRRCRKLTQKGPGVPPSTDTLLVMLITLVFIFFALYGGFAISIGILNIESVVRSVTSTGPIRTVLLAAIDLTPMFFALWTIIPTWGLFSTCLYFDRRVRLEAYDIDALAAFIPAASDR